MKNVKTKNNFKVQLSFFLFCFVPFYPVSLKCSDGFDDLMNEERTVNALQPCLPIKRSQQVYHSPAPFNGRALNASLQNKEDISDGVLDAWHGTIENQF